MLKDSSEKMLVEVAMILMSMYTQGLGPTFAEKNQLSSRVWKENQEDQDSSHPSQLIQVYMVAQQLLQMSRLLQFVPLL